jgi:hypothetical protein
VLSVAELSVVPELPVVISLSVDELASSEVNVVESSDDSVLISVL